MARIPDDLGPHFDQIQEYLKQVLDELQKAGTNAQRVTSRLNYSDTSTPIPVWAGTVEDPKIRALRRSLEPAKIRFGRSNRSAAYEEALQKGDITRRDWGQSFPEKSKEGYGLGQALGPMAGCRYQRYVALKTDEGTRFGTLTVGFTQDPGDNQKLDDIMKDWATEKKPYVKYLKDKFELGGPGKKP
jgi:hypothetical protein